MDKIIFSSAFAFLITFFSIPVIIEIAKLKKLFDEPDERKVHKAVVPTLGGLGIFAGFVMATLVCVPALAAVDLQYFIAATLVIFFLGLKDDILVLSANKKFLGQVVAAGILIKFGGVEITNMHGFLGIDHIPHMASMALTLFTIIVITNSFNLIDGVDGLAGSLGLLTSLVFGTYFFIINEVMFSVMAFALSGALIAFLIYNVSPAKIFMGDTGSLLIGLLNSAFVVKFIAVAGTSSFPLEAAPALGFAILIVPLSDTLRVFSLRILSRRSPFSPDRNHIHHFLLDLGLNHKAISLSCVVANILLILLAYSLRGLGTNIVVAALAVAALSIVAIVFYSRPKPKTIEDTPIQSSSILKPHSVFSLATEVAEQD
jgi:UDP-GlcNAc:undecaprenyl-phosphate/decaprenyl-phosphate GlcNAc-1-phosphate transferase